MNSSIIIKKSDGRQYIRKNCFKLLCGLVFVVLLLVGVFFIYTSKVKQYADIEKKLISVQYNVKEQQIKKENVIRQSFAADDRIEYIDINFTVG